MRDFFWPAGFACEGGPGRGELRFRDEFERADSTLKRNGKEAMRNAERAKSEMGKRKSNQRKRRYRPERLKSEGSKRNAEWRRTNMRLEQGLCPTRPDRTGFRSTYRTAASA